MTHPPERTAEVLRLYHAERWPIGTIASQLGLHHGVVRRVLAREGVLLAPPAPGPSIADPYEPFIRELLAKYPACARAASSRWSASAATPAARATSASSSTSEAGAPSPSPRPTSACAPCPASRPRSTGPTSAT